MIKEIINNYKDNFLRIEYKLGNTCNYKCSYCYPGSNEGTNPWPEIDVAKKHLSHLMDHYVANGRDTFELYLVGGEPTIWKDLPELTQHLKSNYNVAIHIATNASCSVNWWHRNARYYDSIEISVHHETADPNHIIAVADYIYEENINIVANVMMDPDHFNKCQDIIDSLQKSKNQWTIIAKPVHFNGITRYNKEQTLYFDQRTKRYPDLDWYYNSCRHLSLPTELWVVTENNEKKKIPNESWFALNKENYFYGWKCNLGVEHVKVHQDGTISGNCSQKIWGLDFYHNLYNKNFILDFHPEIKPTICSKPICQCTGEIIIKKQTV